MSEPDLDPTIRELRDEIAALDRAIVEGVNMRIELVARLKRYKDSQGIAFVDPEQERRVLDALADANRGPLSGDGLRELANELLELTKREVSRGESSPR
jgi:chorismate mutase